MVTFEPARDIKLGAVGVGAIATNCAVAPRGTLRSEGEISRNMTSGAPTLTGIVSLMVAPRLAVTVAVPSETPKTAPSGPTVARAVVRTEGRVPGDAVAAAVSPAERSGPR
jgi:hypothetical protein